VLRVTADTNVIVSGLNFPGNPRRMLAAAEAGAIRLCVSAAILAEVADVLQREKFGWSATDAKEAVDWIAQISDNIEPTEAVDVVKDDPADNRILECAAAAMSDYVISGDKHLLRLKNFAGKPIIPVVDFLDIVQVQRR
jgi:putative PIN family toxin of toxin-antitoxin system